MNKKYYDGEIVNNVLIKNTYDAGQYLKLIKAFSKEKGVDAVEVIRCKDCKYYRGYAGVVDGYCYMAEWYKRYQYPDDFCSRAERKEHETY